MHSEYSCIVQGNTNLHSHNWKKEMLRIYLQWEFTREYIFAIFSTSECKNTCLVLNTTQMNCLKKHPCQVLACLSTHSPLQFVGRGVSSLRSPAVLSSLLASAVLTPCLPSDHNYRFFPRLAAVLLPQPVLLLLHLLTVSLGISFCCSFLNF
jgi:hypothetical protein